jgi:hypothetical protein
LFSKFQLVLSQFQKFLLSCARVTRLGENWLVVYFVQFWENLKKLNTIMGYFFPRLMGIYIGTWIDICMYICIAMSRATSRHQSHL